MLITGPDRGKSMNKQNIRVGTTVTDLDRAITNHSAVLGGQVKKYSAQDFVFDFPFALGSQNRNVSMQDLTVAVNLTG